MKTQWSFALGWKATKEAQEWALIDCVRCGALAGSPCVALPPPAAFKGMSRATKEGQPLMAAHTQRREQAAVEGRARRHREWLATPEGVAERGQEDAKRRQEDAERRIQDAARAVKAAARRIQDAEREQAQERRDAKREKGGYNWDEDDERGKKRQRLVQWLMAKPRRKSLSEAKIIACRKYP